MTTRGLSLMLGFTLAIIMLMMGAWLFLVPAASQNPGILSITGVDTPTDEECATWEGTGFGIEWQACGQGSKHSLTAVANNPSLAIGTGIGQVNYNATFTDLFCIVSDAGQSATVTIDVRDSTTPFTPGLTVATARCTSSGTSTMSFTQSTISADQYIGVTLTAISTSTIDQLVAALGFTND